MDINDLFDGIAEAFRRYQQEVADNEGTMHKGCITGLAIVFPLLFNKRIGIR